MRVSKYFVALATLLSIAAQSTAQQIHYVRTDASGSADGTSWENAFTSLQDALSGAAPGDEIWVAGGTYLPDQGSGLTPGDRSLSFELKSGVRLHGGFAGTERSKAGRALADNATFLSGDLGGNDDGFVLREENSYHVVRAVNVDDSAVLDGFVVVGGNADGSGADSLGGGILVVGGAPWIVNTRINSSSAGCGGGIAVTDGGAPTIVNAVVNGNKATVGGGFCHRDATPEIINATVTSNYASIGPGMFNDASNPSLVNSIVARNRNSLNLGHCEYWQYTCSTADVSDEIMQRTLLVLDATKGILESGTIRDALAHLYGDPDVVQTVSNSANLAFRLKGGPMVILSDGSLLLSSSGTPEGGTLIPRQGPPSDRRGKSSAIGNDRTIVGEDLNGDGRIDNRDGKRALILSVTGNSDETEVRNLLSATRDYGSIRLEETLETGLGIFKSWEEYDFVYVSSITITMCDSTGSPHGCTSHLIALEGFDQDDETPGIHRLGEAFSAYQGTTVTPLFFRHVYGGELDNMVVYCAGCDITTYGFTDVLGSDNLAVIGWNHHILLEQAAVSNLAALRILTEGIPVPDALRALFQEGLASVAVPDPKADGGIRVVSLRTEYLEDFPPRIIDLPTLHYQPDPASAASSVLIDGEDITQMIDGVVGDDVPDVLRILLTVDGVEPELLEQFLIRFEVGNMDVPDIFDLDDAQLVEGTDYKYVLGLDLDLGFPVKEGLLAIRAIVDVPRGGESEFAVLPSVAAYQCSNASLYDGGRSGAFSGPANWNFQSLTLESIGSPVATGDEFPGPNAHTARLILGPGEPSARINSSAFEYQILGGSVTALNDPFDSSFGFRGGGVVTIDSTSSDSTTWYGTADFTGDHPIDRWSATFRSRFKAVTGSAADRQSPYFKCLTAYRTVWDALHR